MRSVLDFLFAADYPPWPLQVFWKLLTFTGSGVIAYATATTPDISLVGQVLMYPLAAAWFLMGLFGKLGQG